MGTSDASTMKTSDTGIDTGISSTDDAIIPTQQYYKNKKKKPKKNAKKLESSCIEDSKEKDIKEKDIKQDKIVESKPDVVLHKAVDDIEEALHEAMKCVPEAKLTETSEVIEGKVAKSKNDAWMDVVTESELTIDDEEEWSTPEISEFSSLGSEKNVISKNRKDLEDCRDHQKLVEDVGNFDKKHETEISKQYPEVENTSNIESSEQISSSLMSTSWPDDDASIEEWDIYMNEEDVDPVSESVFVPVPSDRPSITVNQPGSFANIVLKGEPVISPEPVEEEKKEYIYKTPIIHVQDDTEPSGERSENTEKVDEEGFTEFVSKKERYRRKTQSTSLLSEEIEKEIEDALNKDQTIDGISQNNDFKDIQQNLDNDVEETDVENEKIKSPMLSESRRIKKSKSPKPKKVKDVRVYKDSKGTEAEK